MVPYDSLLSENSRWAPKAVHIWNVALREWKIERISKILIESTKVTKKPPKNP